MSSVLSWSASVVGNGWLLGAVLLMGNLALARPEGISPRTRWMGAAASMVAVPVLAITGTIGRGDIRVVAETGEPGPWSLVLLWWVGTLVLLIREVRGHLRLRRIREGWRFASEAERRMTNGNPRTLLYTGESGRPVTVGLVRPGVYLPHRALRELDPDVLAKVAGHELAHQRWRDPLVWALIRMIRILFWPIAPLWLLERLVDRESEAAADDEALSGAGCDGRRKYAAALLSVSEWDREVPDLCRSAGLTGGTLMRRIRSVMEGSPEDKPFPGPAFAVIVALTIFAIALSPRMKSGPTSTDDPPNRRVIVEHRIVNDG